MRHFFILAAIVAMPISAWAGVSAADYRCEQEGGGVAFKLPTANSPGKVWQTDPDEEEGLEFTVTRFEIRARGSYDFEANLEGKLFVRGTVRNLKLTYEAYSPEARIWVPVATDLECLSTRRR